MTNYTLNNTFFYRCNQPRYTVFRFKEYDSKERAWDFEVVSDDFLDIEYFVNLVVWKNHHKINFDAVPPQALIDKFSFIEEYADKPFFGPELPINDNQFAVIKALTGYNLISSKSLLTFHYRVFSKSEQSMKIV